MKKNVSMYCYFVKESAYLFVFACVFGVGVMAGVGWLMRNPYILGSAAYFTVMNVLVIILSKGVIENEFFTFRGKRKDFFGISVVSDLTIAILEMVIFGGITVFANTFKEINQKIGIVDVEKAIGKASMLEYVVAMSMLVLLVEAIITFDFMGTKGMFKVFLNSGNRKLKDGIISMIFYVALAIGMGLGLEAFVDIEARAYRIASMVLVSVIIIVLYYFAGKRVMKKEFHVEYE